MRQRPTLEQRFTWLAYAEDTLADSKTTDRERRLALVVQSLVDALFSLEADLVEIESRETGP